MRDQNKRLFRGKTVGRELLSELQRPTGKTLIHGWYRLTYGLGNSS